jgi:hypothetical protein
MNIVFFCQSCGARFEVPPTSAGKKGRFKKCGQMMQIPQAQELASMVAMPALSPAAVGAGVGAAPKLAPMKPAAREGKTGDSLGWLAAANSNVGLAPLTADNLPIIKTRKSSTKPKYDEDLGDSKPYQIGQTLIKPRKGSSGHVASSATILWRNNLGHLQKLFRKVNETAYLISVPFLLLILLGAILSQRQLALACATAVVLLEIARIVSGIANLAIVPFREGITQGVMFLIPPLTFFYLSSHWNQMKKPTMRIVGPIATIAVVFAAFTFVPTLRKDHKMVSVKDIKNEIRKDVKELPGELIGKAKEIEQFDVQDLGKKTEKALGDAAGKINSIGQPDATGKTP